MVISETKRQDTIECLGIVYQKTLLKYQTNVKSRYCIVVQVSSVAQQSGIQEGDWIVAVDGVDVSDKKITYCTQKLLKGEVGTQVVLSIRRKNESFDVTLTRQSVLKKHRGRPCKPNKEEKAKFCMRCDEEYYNLFKDIAKSEGVSVSVLATRLIEEAIERP